MKHIRYICLLLIFIILYNLMPCFTEDVYAQVSVDNPTISCPKETIVDPKTGRTYYYINVDGKTTVKPYVTQQNWNSDGTRFLVSTPDDNKMYEYDTVNETLKFLDSGYGSTALNAVVTPDNQIYYTKNNSIYKIDWNTYTSTLVCAYPYGCTSLGNIQVTNDGRYANGYFSGYSGKNTVARIDLEKGVVDTLLKKDFSYNPDTQGVGHPIINPEYPDLLFFCHEGTTNLIPDRLWLANAKTGEMFNLFEQSERSDGRTGECSGHEVWGMDGEYMYFVKYSQKQNLGQNGLMRVTKDGSEREYINGDFEYWHCYPSPDNNWVVGDTNTGIIAMANTKTHRSVKLCQFKMINYQHPYQPHPVISYSNNAVNWQMADSSGVAGVAWMDITDLTGEKISGGSSEFNSYTDVISYENAVSTSERTVLNGYDCISAKANKALFFDIKDTFAKSTNQRLYLTLSYVDLGNEPLSVVYSSGVFSKGDLHKFEDKEILIPKNNSSEEKTVKLDMGYVNINNIGSFRSDLKISSGGEPVYITNIIPECMQDENASLHNRGAYAVSAKEDDIGKGVCALTYNYVSTYKNHMYSVTDTQGCAQAGISSEKIASAVSAGVKYITAVSDGGMMYEEAADNTGITKQTWFTSKNYRIDTGKTIPGTLYFRITDGYITEQDNELKIFVEYLDKGTTDLTLKYYSTNGIKGINIPRTDTGLWKIASVDISDANMSAVNKGTALATGGEDFCVCGNDADTYISSVSVIKKKDFEYIDINDYFECETGKPKVFVMSDEFGMDVSLREYPKTGWVMEADNYFAPDVSFVNLSCEGFGTDDFFEYTDKTDNTANRGDYLFVQAGRYEQSVGKFRENLESIEEYALNNKLNLVFLTPSYKRSISPKDVLLDDGADIYREEMRNTAKRLGVPLIDVATYHGQLIENLGFRGSKEIFLYDDLTSYPNCKVSDPDGALNHRGAGEIAKIIASEIKKYSETGLASLANLSEYTQGADISAVTPQYQTIEPKTDVTEVMYVIDGSPSSHLKYGNVGMKLKLKNSEQKETDAVMYTVVYGADGSVKDIRHSNVATLNGGETIYLETQAVNYSEGDSLKNFVWTSGLKPYSRRKSDNMEISAAGYAGKAVITWKKPDGFLSGTTYKVYRDGRMIGETDSTVFYDENVDRGEHSWQVNAYNNLGIFLYQSDFAVDYVSGFDDVSDDVFYTKAYIDSNGNDSRISHNMDIYYTNTYYPIYQAQKHYPHVSATNLLEAYRYGDVPYITDSSDGSVRMAKITDSAGVTKDAWQVARVYRVLPNGNTALRNCFMYFNFKDGTITPDDHNVTVYVEYLSDRDSINLQYANCIIDGENVVATDENGVRINNSVTVSDDATGRWRVARFDLKDAYFNKDGTTFVTGKCDMRLASSGKELSVASVTVVRGTPDYADEQIAKLSDLSFYDGNVRNANILYPDGLVFDLTSGEEYSDGLYNIRSTNEQRDDFAQIDTDPIGVCYVTSGVGQEQNYLYFEADDRYIYGNADNTVEIKLTYKADFNGPLYLRAHSYDADKEKLSPCGDILLKDVLAENAWKTEVFRINGTAFINSLSGGSDFALYTPSEQGNLKIKKLIVKNVSVCTN